MKLRTLAIAALFALSVPAAGLAQPAPATSATSATPAPAPSPTKDPLNFDDPGMHFRAPDGWRRLPTSDAVMDGGRKFLAAYQLDAGRDDTRTIFITSEPTTGSLDTDETSHESDLRNAIDGTLVNHKEKTTLANGMPAWFLTVTEGSDPLHSQKLFEYVVFDGTRMICAGVTVLPFAIDDRKAKELLKSLYVVVYPQGRP